MDARLDEAGVGRYTKSLVAALASLDPTVEYVLLLRKASFEAFMAPAANVSAVCADFPWYSVREQIRLPAVLRGQDPDVVHYTHFNVPLATPHPYVVTIHDLTHMNHSFARAGVGGQLAFHAKRLPYRRIIKKAASRAAHVITVSEHSKAAIIGHLRVDPARVTVTYEAAGRLSAVEARPRHRTGTHPYFLYVGNAFPYKNIRRTIEAFGRFAQDADDEHQFLLAGNHGDFADGLLETARRAGVAERVRLVGRVTDAELDRLYRGATALVFASLSEGFGLPGLEAMRRGTPVIAARATALPEIYGNAAMYVDPCSVVDIASAMSRVACDPGLAAELAARGRERERSYSWERTARQTLDVYRGVADTTLHERRRVASRHSHGCLS
jgi:glycosyltransferase involved in cell wall biosynthesis